MCQDSAGADDGKNLYPFAAVESIYSQAKII